MSVNKLLTSINTEAGIQKDRTPGTLRLSVSSENYYRHIKLVHNNFYCLKLHSPQLN